MRLIWLQLLNTQVRDVLTALLAHFDLLVPNSSPHLVKGPGNRLSQLLCLVRPKQSGGPNRLPPVF